VPSIYSVRKKKQNSVAITRSPSPVMVGGQSFLSRDLNPTILRFVEFWELIDVVEKHGYLRAAMSVVGRSTVGTWWTLRRHAEYGKRAPDRHRRRLINFYMPNKKEWNNIKDFQTFAYKLMIGAMYLKLVGQVAYHIIRDANNQAVGLDHLPGLVIPNVDSSGYFKTPAFVQYPTKNPKDAVFFNNPRDIVFITTPDWRGSPMGGSDIEALTEYILPLDIYLQVAARDYMKNRDKPEVVYELAPDISEEGFNNFVEELNARHSGPANMGRNPIAVQGEFKVHELRPYPNSLPYQDSRKAAREEELAVAGVSGAKMGISDQMASANIRELRREFHETSMRPLFRLIEIAFYEQIHVREFGFMGWEFTFSNPDFLSAVERATVDMRYHDMGVLTPNEIRHDSLDKEPRKDEQGDMYVDQGSDAEDSEPTDYPGSPPEGRPVEPDDPSQTGEPTLDDQDPPRGDGHDETTRDNVLRELRQWRTFVIRRMRYGRKTRDFNTREIRPELRDLIKEYVGRAVSPSEVTQIFNEVIEAVEEAYDAS